MSLVVQTDHLPRMGLNVVANYVGKLWGIASVYVFIPIYVNLLGIDAYGLIAFNAIVLGLLYIADAGLSSSFAREAAKVEPGQRLLDLLISIERTLFSILIVVSLVFLLMTPIIGSDWLKSTGILPEGQVRQCLWLMGITIIPQIAMSLYLGGLMGLQRQVSANLLLMGFSIVRSGLVVVPIYYMPDIRVFFVWQMLASVAMLIVIRKALFHRVITPMRRTTSEKIKGNFSWDALNTVRGYALGMMGMAIIAGLSTQMDKIVASKMLPLNEFAEYSLASTLAQIPYIVTLPIATALLPRLTNLTQRNDQHDELKKVYRNSSFWIAMIGTVAGFGLYLFIPDIFSLWMRDQTISADTLQAASLLAIGSTFLTLQLAPFQLSLANGHQATNLRLGVLTLLFYIPLQILLTQQFGVVGAAIPWMLLNAVSFVYLGIALNIRFELVSLSQWFVADTLAPVLMAILWLLVARWAADLLQTGEILSCVIAAFGALAAVGSSIVWRHCRILQLNRQSKNSWVNKWR